MRGLGQNVSAVGSGSAKVLGQETFAVLKISEGGEDKLEEERVMRWADRWGWGVLGLTGPLEG